MKFIKNIAASLKPAVGRFPVTFLLGFVTAIVLSVMVHINFSDASSTQSDQLETILAALARTTIWCMVFSCAAGLAVEQLARALFLSRKKQRRMITAFWLANLVLVVPMYFLWRIESERMYLAYGMTLFALVALCPYLLHFTQKDDEIVLNISFSALISSIISCCVGTGLTIIWMAFIILIHDFKDAEQVYLWIWIFTFFVVWIGCFVSYASKAHEDISIPKSCKVIFLYVLFPLYLLLLVVLYAYLAKCIITLSLPMREINLFASFASALYLLFYLTLSYYQTKAVRLFTRFGAFVLLPLIAVQCYISVDRILAHGVSIARYASVLYITFSIVVIFLSFVKKGKFMLYCCPVLAALALFSSLTPWNLIDVPFRSQTGIIIHTLEKHGLFVDGRILAERTAAELSDEDKNTIIRAYHKLLDTEREPDWYVHIADEADKNGGGAHFDFEETFGFAQRKYGEAERRQWVFKLEMPAHDAIAISPYTELYQLYFENANYNTILKYADCRFDMREKFTELWKESAAAGGKKQLSEPLVFSDSRGYTVFITFMSMSIWGTEDEFWEKVNEGDFYSSVRGFACRRKNE